MRKVAKKTPPETPPPREAESAAETTFVASGEAGAHGGGPESGQAKKTRYASPSKTAPAWNDALRLKLKLAKACSPLYDRMIECGCSYCMWQIPDFAENLDAMHSMEERFFCPGERWDRYLHELLGVCGVEYVHTLVHATARQRAEATVRMIDKGVII